LRAFSPPYDVADLLALMRLLRDPDHGCPWDREQTFATIVPSTLEESYELAAAIEDGDFPHIAEELGDLLFQVVFYAQLGAEQSQFSFDSIVDALVGKLIRRHPHVFAPADAAALDLARRDVGAVMQSWEEIKQRERDARALSGTLADVPLQLPALVRAQKLQKRAASVGFDWPDRAGVLEKIDEELCELRAALMNGDEQVSAGELGDVLFTVVNLARHMGIDAESALRSANRKFEERFHGMEELACSRGAAFAELSAEEQESLWREVKDGGAVDKA